MSEPIAKSLSKRAVTLLFAGNVLGYLDRSAFAVVAPLMASELRLTPLELGWLLSAFSIGYVATTFFGGLAADRFGAGRVIAVSAIVWSIFCALSAAPVAFWVLFLIRIAFGIGEAPYTPAINTLVAATTPPNRYSGILGLISTGQPWGGLLAAPVVGGLAIAFGWRVAFVAIGAMGILWAVLWIHEIRRSPVSGGQRVAAISGHTGRGIVRTLGDCIKSPPLLSILIAYFSFAFILYFLISWFPSYLVKGLGVSMEKMSGIAAIPWALGIAGLLAGGIIVNVMQRWPWGAVTGRKLLLSVGLVLAGIATTAMAFTTDVTAVVALMSIATFWIYLTGTCYLGLVRELVEPAALGSVGGFVVIGLSLAGIVAPALTGLIIERTGNYDNAFLMVGGVAIAGALIVQLFVHPGPAGAPLLLSASAIG